MLFLLLNITYTINPLYNHAFDDHFFFLTLTNSDLNMYSYIPYKSLQDCDYKQKNNNNNLQNNLVMLK
jgi:hypothetical protein